MENFNQAQYESLTSRMMLCIRKVKNQETLLKIACTLLDASIGILLESWKTPEGKYSRKIIRVWPDNFASGVDLPLDSLCSWYANQADQHEKKESELYVAGNSLNILDNEYPDALVAFGEDLTDELNPPRNEILLIQKPGASHPYSSYHCWVARELLKQFEYFIAVTKFQKVLSAKELLSDLTLEAIPNVNWTDLCDWLRSINDNSIKACFYIIWAGYQQRKHSKDEKKKPTDWQDIEDLLCSQEELHGKLNKNKADLNLKEIHHKVCKAVLKPGFKDWKTTAGELGEKIFPSTHANPDEKKRWVQIALVFLEHGWQRVRRPVDEARSEIVAGCGKNMMAPDPASLHVLYEMADALLSLTRALAIDTLFPSDAENYKDLLHTEKPFRVDKNFRWFYLATELVKNSESRLKKIYCNNGKPDKTPDVSLKSSRHPEEAEHLSAPPELRRQFLLNLSRFMLGTVGRLQRLNGIKWDSEPSMPMPVSPSEELDSLVYIVDRYAHVELQVDERLAIRQHLARQLPAEIGHYLGRNPYRDHLLHAIDVFLFGHLLLHTSFNWLGRENRTLVKHLAELSIQQNNGRKKGNCLDEKAWMRNWAVASLLHDIGYQLDQRGNSARTGEEWTNYFKVPGCDSTIPSEQADRPFSPALGKIFAEELGKFISNKADLQEVAPFFSGENLVDHGVLSALRVGQVLCQPWGSKEAEGKPVNYRQAIFAMACHNLVDVELTCEEHPLACLLRLCDELQEWGRTQINLEKVMKQLYLDIQERSASNLTTYELVDAIHINIRLKKKLEKGIPACAEFELIPPDDDDGYEGESLFRFRLQYLDAEEAAFNAAMTLLMKAYNLQRLNFQVSVEPQRTLGFLLEMEFPRPKRYGSLTEYDIIALHGEEQRIFPLLTECDEVRPGLPGLVRLMEKAPQVDRFGIARTGTPNPTNEGWLDINPAIVFKEFTDFKNSILLKRGGCPLAK